MKRDKYWLQPPNWVKNASELTLKEIDQLDLISTIRYLEDDRDERGRLQVLLYREHWGRVHQQEQETFEALELAGELRELEPCYPECANPLPKSIPRMWSPPDPWRCIQKCPHTNRIRMNDHSS